MTLKCTPPPSKGQTNSFERNYKNTRLFSIDIDQNLLIRVSFGCVARIRKDMSLILMFQLSSHGKFRINMSTATSNFDKIMQSFALNED